MVMISQDLWEGNLSISEKNESEIVAKLAISSWLASSFELRMHREGLLSTREATTQVHRYFDRLRDAY